MTMMQIFATSQFGWDREYQAVLEKLLIATLEIDPSDVAPVTFRPPDDRIILAPADDLKAQLAYATFGVVGKSGYTRATISRIARRANCSPGAIYKLYPSKEDLVIAAFHDLMRARWMKFTNFVDLLDEGALSQLLYSSASEQNVVRQSFTLETALAGVHSDKLRDAVLGQIGELESIVPLLKNVGEDEKLHLRYLIRSIVFVTAGINFLSTVTDVTRHVDFNQFGEPFRRALLRDVVPTWSEMCQQIMEVVNSRALTRRSRRRSTNHFLQPVHDGGDDFVLSEQVLLDLLGFFQHRFGVLVRLFGPLVDAAAWMFCPTMMIGSSTNCKKLLESHTMMKYVPCLMASAARRARGREDVGAPHGADHQRDSQAEFGVRFAKTFRLGCAKVVGLDGPARASEFAARG